MQTADSGAAFRAPAPGTPAQVPPGLGPASTTEEGSSAACGQQRSRFELGCSNQGSSAQRTRSGWFSAEWQNCTVGGRVVSSRHPPADRGPMTASTSFHSSGHPKPRTLGELKRIPDFDARTTAVGVKDEIRRNLLRKIEREETLFPGVHGYEDTVVPQIINALLSRHNFILLGLRGQAKSRILRGLIGLLDPEVPVIAGCEINDNPFSPICRSCKNLVAKEGDNTPIAWMPRDQRYVEKLATPDVTIADIIGDVDPIRAARGGRDLSDELTIHYGLLPRANRGVFAINELPDLAGKIQVGLFNIMQEGDIQIKGYPLRLPLDVLLVFSANPE